LNQRKLKEFCKEIVLKTTIDSSRDHIVNSEVELEILLEIPLVVYVGGSILPLKHPLAAE
jgi:hypothetical protein